jgi:hypothetical protein
MHEALQSTVDDLLDQIKKRGIEAGINFLRHYLYNPKMSAVIAALFRNIGLAFANRRYKELFKFVKEFRRQQVAKESASFGFSEEWNNDISDYLIQYLLKRAVIPVTDTTKQALLQILQQAQQNGWGIPRIEQELRNADVVGLTRAQRIVRTELTIAANFGNKMALDKIPFETQKVWISCKDFRVRESHQEMDSVQIDSEADFEVPIIKKKAQVGVDLMTGPGDPEASAGNVINCRCVLAYVPKRDKSGRLISLTNKKIAA